MSSGRHTWYSEALRSSYHYSYSRPQASTYIFICKACLLVRQSKPIFVFIFDWFQCFPLAATWHDMLWACAVMFELIPHGYSRWSCNYLGSRHATTTPVGEFTSQSVRLLIWVDYHHHSKLNAKDIRLMITMQTSYVQVEVSQTNGCQQKTAF